MNGKRSTIEDAVATVIACILLGFLVGIGLRLAGIR